MTHVINIVWLPKYNIGLVKEFRTLQKMVSLNSGHQTREFMGSHVALIVFMEKMQLRRNDLNLLVYNISRYSWAVLIFAKLLRVNIIQFLHEPGMADKLNYGYLRAFKICVLELLVYLSVIFSNQLVTFSPQARKISRKQFPSKLIHEVTLLPYLSIPIQSDKIDKKYPLIFVGTIHPAKNFSIFMSLANQIYEQTNLKSCVISKSKSFLEKGGYLNAGCLDVITKDIVHDETIEEGLISSSVLFKLDRNMMQSGLLAQAMYFSVTALISDIDGFRQDYNENFHIISSDKDPNLTKTILRILHVHERSNIDNFLIKKQQCKEIHLMKISKWEMIKPFINLFPFFNRNAALFRLVALLSFDIKLHQSQSTTIKRSKCYQSGHCFFI